MPLIEGYLRRRMDDSQTTLAKVTDQKPRSKSPHAPTWEQRVRDYLDKQQSDLDKMVDAYKRNDIALGECIYKQHFSPTTIAKQIAGDLDVNDRGSVGRTNAYKNRVRKYRDGRA